MLLETYNIDFYRTNAIQCNNIRYGKNQNLVMSWLAQSKYGVQEVQKN
jgi:hypothetical protein